MAKPPEVRPEPKPGVIAYGFSRHLATGCWVYTVFELPEDVAARYAVHVDEPRHMLGALSMVERDVFRRDHGIVS
jgi:hypothetical protein